jgi:hypothetical protein
MGERADWLGQRLPHRRHHPRGEGAGGRQRDLLAEHRPDRQLSPVHRAGHAQPGPRRHERAEEPIGGEMGIGRRRGVARAGEPPQRRLGRGTIARVAGDELAVEGHDARAVGQADDAAVDAAGDLLDAGDRAEGQETDQVRRRRTSSTPSPLAFGTWA